MPKSTIPRESRVTQAREALEAYLAERDMGITTLAELAEVTQSQASKLIRGNRKKWCKDLEKLCQYAKIKIDNGPVPWYEHPQLGPAIKKAVGDSEQAQALLGRIVAAMTPALTALQPGAQGPGGKKVKS